MRVVLDSSALLALLWDEAGSKDVAAVLDSAIMSAVNMAEVCSKLVDRGIHGESVRSLLSDLPVRIIAFDEQQAFGAGELRAATRDLGLSIGDRACLGLALLENARVVTADRAWSTLQLGIGIDTIR